MQFSLRSLLVLVFLAALMLTVFRSDHAWHRERMAVWQLYSADPLPAYDEYGARKGDFGLRINARDEATLSKGLEQIKYCSSERSLAIHGDISRKNWQRLRELKHLEFLSITACPPADTAEGLSHIRQLRVCVDDEVKRRFEPFLARTNVSELIVSDFLEQNMPIDYSQLRAMRSLRTLRVVAVPSDRQLADIFSLPVLHELELNGVIANSGSFEKIAQLKFLHTLLLRNCSIAPGELARLSQLPRLKRLAVSDCTLDEAALRDIGQCANLTALSFNGSRLVGVEFGDLAQLTRLRRLYVSCPYPESAGPNQHRVSMSLATLPAFPLLEELTLDRVEAEPADWKSLSRFKRLRRLSATKANIPDAAVRDLLRIPSFCELNISSDQISDGELQTLWLRSFQPNWRVRKFDFPPPPFGSYHGEF